MCNQTSSIYNKKLMWWKRELYTPMSTILLYYIAPRMDSGINNQINQYA